MTHANGLLYARNPVRDLRNYLFYVVAEECWRMTGEKMLINEGWKP